ncbi:MAG TPA: 4-hydroxy-tetrahydrodipicolinate synthase [Thermomicrobiales bacterium]|nr:4-hydroxy-tetrahydrodipicolinate synthase [Thermomicrobiales bacterium]
MTATELRTRTIDLAGTWTALITPFRDGQIDEPALRALVESNIAGGVSGLVACGTTAETPTLTAAESHHVIDIVIGQARGRVPVMVGTGSNDTQATLAHTIEAQAAGADAALIVMPYYNRPTQEGLYQHIRYVAERVDIPIVLYNVPGRTGSDIQPATVARLALIPNVIGIKEATGNLDRASEIVRLTGPDFAVLSGDDSLTLPIMAVGGRGIISVASNVIPEAISSLTTAALAGDFLRARTIHLEVLEFCGAIFVETNPVPIKTAAELLGLTTSEVRLPMVPLQPESRERLFRAMLDCPHTAQRVVIGEETAWTAGPDSHPIVVAA